MEVTVGIKQAWIKDVQRFKLRCRVQAAGPGSSGEAHEGSVSIGQPAASSETKQHQLAFSFALRSPPQFSLLFAASSPRYDSTPSRHENELGRCAGALATSQSLEHTQTLFLCQQVPDTNVERYAGKLTFTVRLRATGGADLASLLSDEAKRACPHVLPSESPFVSVVFHCVYAGVDDPTRELVGAARIGDRSDVGVGSLLQESSPQLRCLPLLKPVRLSCQEFDCLELHVADSKSGAVHFSSSHALSRLTPFRPTHFNYDRQSVPSRGGRVLSKARGDAKGPSVSVSALYTPFASQFGRYQGLEVAVCEVSPPRQVSLCTNLVMGVQLLQANSKGKTPTHDGHSIDPPFQPPKKKSGSLFAVSSDQDYHISVLQYQGKELNSACVVKSYHFFHCSLPKSGGLYLLFHIYGSTGIHVWWNTDSHTQAKLEISEENLALLEKGDLPMLHWSASDKDQSSKSCTMSGVLRWKLRKMKFLTESSVRAALDTPAQITSAPQPNQHEPSYQQNEPPSSHVPNYRECTAGKEPHQLQPPYPASTQQPLEELLASPTEDSGAGNAEVLKQLAEFESSLRQMASDFCTLCRENRRLKSDNEQLALEMATLWSLVSTTSGSPTDTDLQSLSKSDLILRARSLQQGLEAEKRINERSREMNEVLQRDVSALRDLEERHLELREMHKAQQTLVQTLRGKVAKYHKCLDICRKQESVITQLESLLAKQARGHPSAKDDAISLLGRENAQLRTLFQQSQASGDGSSHGAALLEKDQTIHSLKSQLSQLATRCKNLETQKGGGVGVKSEERREFEVQLFELEQKLLVAEAKLSAQSCQLEENAEKWVREKASYELKLAEYRGRLEKVIRSGQQALAGTTTATTQADSRVQGGAEGRTEGQQQYSTGKTSKKDYSF